MSEDTLMRAYDAIKQFVDELFTVFGGGKPTPLALYYRIIQKIQPTETERIEQVVGGFTEFCSKYSSYLIEQDKPFPENVNIGFVGSSKVYIQISTFIQQSDPESRNVIYSHLLAISSILEKDPERAKALTEKFSESVSSTQGQMPPIADIMKTVGLDTNSEEGKYVENIMSKVDGVVKNMNGLDTSDPMTMIGALMSSGALTDMFSGGGEGEGAAAPDPKKLMKVFKKILNQMVPDE